MSGLATSAQVLDWPGCPLSVMDAEPLSSEEAAVAEAAEYWDDDLRLFRVLRNKAGERVSASLVSPGVPALTVRVWDEDGEFCDRLVNAVVSFESVPLVAY